MNADYEALLIENDLLKAKIDKLARDTGSISQELELYRKALVGSNERIKAVVHALAAASSVIVETSDLLKANGIVSSTLEFAKSKLDGIIKDEIETHSRP